jgi:hypothetical protein
VQNPIATATIPAERGDRTLYLGVDREGSFLEVISAPTEDGILIIHAMLMRPRYRSLL